MIGYTTENLDILVTEVNEESLTIKVEMKGALPGEHIEYELYEVFPGQFAEMNVTTGENVHMSALKNYAGFNYQAVKLYARIWKDHELEMLRRRMKEVGI